MSNTRARVIKWHKYSSPVGSTLPDAFLSGKIACYVIAMGVANSEITIDLNKIDPGFAKLSPLGKRAFAHGIKQRLVDGTGGKSPQEVYTILRDTAKLLESGLWFAPQNTAKFKKLEDLATDMATAKFTIKFTDENRNEMVILVASADDKTLAGYTEQVAVQTLERKARELEAEKKELAKAAKNAPALTF